MTISIPNNDVSIFKQIMERMGWIIQNEKEEKPTFSYAETMAAERRVQQLDRFVEKFHTDEISEEDIFAEVDVVREQLYESKQQTH